MARMPSHADMLSTSKAVNYHLAEPLCTRPAASTDRRAVTCGSSITVFSFLIALVSDEPPGKVSYIQRAYDS